MKKNINRVSLRYSLMQDGIHGKSHIDMKSIYNQTQCAIKINDNMTDFYLFHKVSNKDAKSHQHFFAIYINDLANGLNALNLWNTAKQQPFTCIKIVLRRQYCPNCS